MAQQSFQVTFDDNSVGAQQEFGTEVWINTDSRSMVVTEYDKGTRAAWMHVGSAGPDVELFSFALELPLTYVLVRTRQFNANGFTAWDPSPQGRFLSLSPPNAADKPNKPTNTGIIAVGGVTPTPPPEEPPPPPPPGSTNPTVIGLGPDQQTVNVGQTVPLTVTLSNAHDTLVQVALNSSVEAFATVPATLDIPIGQQGGQFLVTGVAAGVSHISGTYNSTARGTDVTVLGSGEPPPSQGGNWPNQPVGSTLLSDRDASLLRQAGGGWVPTWPNGGNVVTGNGPVSPPNALEWTWTHVEGSNGANYPQPVFNFGSGGVTNFYFAYKWQIRSPFVGWNNCINKVALVKNIGGGQFYNALFRSQSTCQQPPWIPFGLFNYTTDNTHLGAVGNQSLFPNVGSGTIPENEWVTVELHLVKSSSSTSRDGIYRQFINGALRINHTNVNYPSGNFQEQLLTPIWDGWSPPFGGVDREWFDHVRITTGGTY